MSDLSHTLRLTLAGVAAATLSLASAEAALMATGSVGGAPIGVARENFDGLPLGTAGGLTPSGITVNIVSNGQAVTGSSAGLFAAPFLSGGNGLGFGPGGTDQANGVDATTYLTSGSTGSAAGAEVELVLPGLMKYFGLLWGSVDDYNTLTFYNGAVSVGSLTGLDILAAPNGDQGVNGTLYVNINSDLAFNRVVATSTQFAFEFDNVAFNPIPVVGVPAPMSLALLGAGLLGLGFARRGQRTA
jgi:hypothetical protein